MLIDDIPATILARFRKGCVIPAHPLALDQHRQLDERHQRALARYYLDAGSGGLAVGVHTTQFAIREVGLFEPVLRLAAIEADTWGNHMPFMVAGVMGKTAEAVNEARIARALGYHAVLLGLGALGEAGENELIGHCRSVADIMPVIGFYLQTAVGGRDLSFAFWARFAQIPNVVGIKMAPFNRYKTLDVIRGVAAAGARSRVTLYTGNDDHIIGDLLTRFMVETGGEPGFLSVRGGLLGHWSVWTKRAVELVDEISKLPEEGKIFRRWWTRDAAVTDCNGAFFDAANNFKGVIAGLHEVLRRQGLLDNILCLDPNEGLGNGQMDEIDRVYRLYPDLNDDEFVRENLDRWLAE